MTPADLDAIVASTTDPAVATLARALREAWAERDAARVASTPNEREAMLRAALDNREAYARDLAALVVHSDQRAASVAAERDAALAAVDAVRADYAPRAEPLTADEVRAAAKLWDVDFARVLVTVASGGQRWCEILRIEANRGTIAPVYSDDRRSFDRANGWLPLSPAGPVAWSELAWLVERSKAST